MPSAKTAILARIRSAQKAAKLPEFVNPPRNYLVSGTTDPEELREVLIDRLEDYKADVHLCEESDRKSTRLNSSHVAISYAVFCLKKKKKSTRRGSTQKEHTSR